MATGNAATLDEIERAALTGLYSLREDGSWTISNQIGLCGDVQGFSIPDVQVPYAKNLDLGQAICFDVSGEIGDGLAEELKGLGLGTLYGVPVMRGGRCIASIAIGSRSSHLFSERDRAFVRIFTLYTSVFILVALYTDGVTEYARDAIAGEKKLCDAIAMLVGNAAIAQPAKFIFDFVLGSKPRADDALQFCIQDASLPADFFAQTKHWRFHASDAHAAHVMRIEVGDYLRHLCGDTKDAFTCEVIVGELLANTVEHAPGLVHMAVVWNGQHSVLVVRDNGPGFQRKVAALPYQLSEGGRGLFLVEALSVGMTVLEAADGGAELRVELPVMGRLSE